MRLPVLGRARAVLQYLHGIRFGRLLRNGLDMLAAEQQRTAASDKGNFMLAFLPSVRGKAAIDRQADADHETGAGTA